MNNALKPYHSKQTACKSYQPSQSENSKCKQRLPAYCLWFSIRDVNFPVFGGLSPFSWFDLHLGTELATLCAADQSAITSCKLMPNLYSTEEKVSLKQSIAPIWSRSFLFSHLSALTIVRKPISASKSRVCDSWLPELKPGKRFLSRKTVTQKHLTVAQRVILGVKTCGAPH